MAQPCTDVDVSDKESELVKCDAHVISQLEKTWLERSEKKKAKKKQITEKCWHFYPNSDTVTHKLMLNKAVTALPVMLYPYLMDTY